MTRSNAGTMVRAVGFWGLAALVFNGIVGAGIFALPGGAARFAGGMAPLVVIAVCLALMPIVLLMARLSALYDETGGPICYARDAFGRSTAFQLGWMQSLSSATSAAANSNLCADYVARLLPAPLAGPLGHALLVLLLLGIVGAIAYAPVARGDAVLRGASLAKLAPLILLLVLALPAALITGGAVPQPAEPSLPRAVTLAAFAFVGFEVALTSAGEARSPQRDFPRALLLVFPAVGVLYAALCSAYGLLAFDPAVTDGAPLATLAARLVGVGGTLLIVMAAVASILGNVTTSAMVIPRRLVALVGIGQLPGWFGRIDARGVPTNGTVFTMAVLVALALGGGFAVLAMMTVASRLIVYAVCIAALPRIDRGRGAWTLAVIGGAVCAGLVIMSEPASWLAVAVAAVVGVALQALARATPRPA